MAYRSNQNVETQILRAFATSREKDLESFRAGWVAGMSCPRGLSCRWTHTALETGTSIGHSCNCPARDVSAELESRLTERVVES